MQDVIALRYRELACAVLQQYADDYLNSRYYGYDGKHKLREIDDMWFILTGINKEKFISKLIEKGDKKYGLHYK